MLGASGSYLLLILIALGIVAVILSFLVPDRKKSFISLILGGVVVAVGIVLLGVQMKNDFSWRRRVNTLREQQQVDLEKMREEFKKRASEAPQAAPKK